MKATRFGIFGALAALMFAAATQAQTLSPSATEPVYSPFAANAWAGLGIYHSSVSAGGFSASSTDFGLAFGGDVGYRFTEFLAAVIFLEDAPIFTSGNSGNLLSVGAGVRLQPAIPVQFTVGVGYANLSSGGSGAGGFTVKGLAFWPLYSGFGPYAQLAYTSISNNGATDGIFGVNAGISYSY